MKNNLKNITIAAKNSNKSIKKIQLNDFYRLYINNIGHIIIKPN
jgi:hypothetical protein